MNKQKYIHVHSIDGDDGNTVVGTVIADSSLEERFRKCVEEHFDADLMSISFVHVEINSLNDCVSAYPIDVDVVMGEPDDYTTYRLELSQTWIY